MINSLDNQFRYYIKNYGVSVLVDGAETTVFFKEIENSTGNDTKYIFSDIGMLKQGHIIEALSDKWLLVNKEISLNGIYDKAIVRKIRFDINFVIDDTLVAVPAFVDNKAIDISTGEYFSLDESKIIVTIPSAYSVDVNDRFIKMDSAWVVVSKDLTTDGLVALYCQRDSILTDDDMENEIPAGFDGGSGGGTTEPIEITITGSDTIKQYSAQTYTIDVDVTWSISNSNVTISEQTTRSITLYGSKMGSVVLSADDGTNTYTKDITVKSVF